MSEEGKYFSVGDRVFYGTDDYAVPIATGTIRPRSDSGADFYARHSLACGVAKRIASALNAVAEVTNPEPVAMLVSGCRILINAPHQEHFAARLNDVEMQGLDAIKEALSKMEGKAL